MSESITIPERSDILNPATRIDQLIRVVEASTEASDKTSAVEATLGAVLAAVDCEGMTFLLKTDDGYALVARENVSDYFAGQLEANREDLATMFAPFEHAASPLVLRRMRGKGWVIERTGTALPEAFLNSTAFETALWLPLRHRRKLLGFLCMGTPERRDWSTDELGWLSDLARVTSAIIHHATVIENAKRAELARARDRAERELRDHVMQALGYSLFQDMSSDTIREVVEVDTQGLTDREISVLEQVATGASNKEIASALYMSENTVKKHLQNILTKLNLSNRVQVAVYAVEKGFGTGR